MAITEQSKDWSQLLSAEINQRGRWYFYLSYRVVRDTQAAEDACQHAFCQAWQHQNSIARPEAIRSWLARAVVNASLTMLRKKRSESRVLARHLNHEASHSTEDRVAQREAIWLAIDSLDPAVREVVVLRLVEGLSGNEVKAILGCSAALVSQRLHAGLDQLRAHLVDFVPMAGGG